MYEEIKNSASTAMAELISKAKPDKGQIIVVGCSSSEIMGNTIGMGAAPKAASAVLDGILPLIKENGLYLAAQCCEHLNRALVLEREAAVKFGLETVSAVPSLDAGGAFAAACFTSFSDPVLVEHIKAAAGLDIGSTLIGMHLKHVAVPQRLKTKKIGHAPVVAASTRPKFIGGLRTQYE